MAEADFVWNFICVCVGMTWKRSVCVCVWVCVCGVPGLTRTNTRGKEVILICENFSWPVRCQCLKDVQLVFWGGSVASAGLNPGDHAPNLISGGASAQIVEGYFLFLFNFQAQSMAPMETQHTWTSRLTWQQDINWSQWGLLMAGSCMKPHSSSSCMTEVPCNGWSDHI